MKIASGTLEALKWFALVLMLGDHINLALFDRSLPVLTEIARIVFPIFALVLGYNLARPGADWGRVLKRLVIVATIAQPFHYVAFDRALPVNVLYTFAAGLAVISQAEKGRVFLAAMLFLAAGLVVDYRWPGVGLLVSAFYLARSPSLVAWMAISACMVGLAWINGNFYALWALPVVFLASRVNFNVQRSPWAFYTLYPAHLAVLAALVVLLH